MKQLLAVKKGDSYTGLKEWTEDEVIEIYERASNSGKDFYDALYDIFLERAGGDPRQAFRDMLDLAYQWFNIGRYGNRKPADETADDVKIMHDFFLQVPDGKRTWARFQKFCMPRHTPFGRTKFFELRSQIKSA